jgi:hypothetical protein
VTSGDSIRLIGFLMTLLSTLELNLFFWNVSSELINFVAEFSGIDFFDA